MDYEDLDDDRTIRASKSTSRGGIGGILNGHGSKGKANGRDRNHDDHDLDLESLHGSIVFHNREDDTDQGYSHRSGDDGHHSSRDADGKEDERQGSRINEKDDSDWTQESGTVRRRRGKSAAAQQDGDHSPMRPSLDTVRPIIASGDPDFEVNSRLAHRRRNSRSSTSKYQRSRVVHASSTNTAGVSRRTGSTNGADHPRFRGSLLYAYTFRNLVWSAIAFFLIGMLLRVYVIGPSFLKTAASSSTIGGANGRGTTTTTFYYYYRAAAPTASGSTFKSSSSALRSRLPVAGSEEDRDDASGGGGGDAGMGGGGGMDSSVWPQGIQEVFTIRRILGWDFVLLAYPSQDQQQQHQQQQTSPINTEMIEFVENYSSKNIDSIPREAQEDALATSSITKCDSKSTSALPASFEFIKFLVNNSGVPTCCLLTSLMHVKRLQKKIGAIEIVSHCSYYGAFLACLILASSISTMAARGSRIEPDIQRCSRLWTSTR
ncbi:hypothetical protein BGZ95_006972 [Linnemannia exigua]|uniref:Uncharacterized protein n=1 Tax=Linnemannia exigua TaxID=604196 RepID=A0AAD4H0G6_9FUNG|nr:hypothetical protein BGZ95_006972 [Linnemannia exigua]